MTMSSGDSLRGVGSPVSTRPESPSRPTHPRYSAATKRKASGAEYTPPKLALFVAKRMVSAATIPRAGRIRILDPAAGDGALLHALLASLPAAARKRCEVYGMDTDRAALSTARARLEEAFPGVKFKLEDLDFLDFALGYGDHGDLFRETLKLEKFDLVIANPPYVRTQVLGGERARLLAEQFTLSGRVDLCYAFLLAIGMVLSGEGTAGIIVSNRFLTTMAGKNVRKALLSRFSLQHIWDLGDTKLFGAAVLPAVILAKGLSQKPSRSVLPAGFSSLYQSRLGKGTVEATDPLTLLEEESGSIGTLVDGRSFRVLHGVVANEGDPVGVWRLSNDATDSWLSAVQRKTWSTFSRIGKVRVGVKTTADEVFIRDDWDLIPEVARPELLRELTSRECARPYRGVVPTRQKQILYPYECDDRRRRPVELGMFPNSKSYLENHRSRLEGRSYVIEAGRRWYEIWVPQDPAKWADDKLVFPDIAEVPIAWIDQQGTIVNGDCYWLAADPPAGRDLLWLALAIANSSFLREFYDRRFNNKLYAGRRRFITQYVQHFPLPDPDLTICRQITDLAKEIFEKTPSAEATSLALKADRLVWKAFGLPLKEIPR